MGSLENLSVQRARADESVDAAESLYRVTTQTDGAIADIQFECPYNDHDLEEWLSSPRLLRDIEYKFTQSQTGFPGCTHGGIDKRPSIGTHPPEINVPLNTVDDFEFIATNGSIVTTPSDSNVLNFLCCFENDAVTQSKIRSPSPTAQRAIRSTPTRSTVSLISSTTDTEITSSNHHLTTCSSEGSFSMRTSPVPVLQDPNQQALPEEYSEVKDLYSSTASVVSVEVSRKPNSSSPLTAHDLSGCFDMSFKAASHVTTHETCGFAAGDEAR